MVSETHPLKPEFNTKSLSKLDHPVLVDLLQRAYSAEKAAAYAYQGHAASVRNKEEKIAIRQIEEDEWNHRKEVLHIMNYYNIPISRHYERRFAMIGKLFLPVVT